MPFNPNIPGVEHATPDVAGANPGLYPANIGSLGGYATEKSVGTVYDWDPYAILTEIHQRHMMVSDFRFILRALGMSRGVSAPTTGHYERDWHYTTIELGSTITASSGAGTSVVIALSTGSMLDLGFTVNGSSTNIRSSNTKVGDIIEFPNGVQGQITAKNTSVNPHRLTIKPLKAAQEIPAVTSGDKVAVVTNAFAEGSGLPTSSYPRITKYTNSFHIVKAAAGITGSNLTNKTFVEFGAGGNGSIWGVVTEDMMAEFERMANGALLFGQTNDNLTFYDAELEIDVPVKTTQGMKDWASTYGHTNLYTPGSYSLADFDAISRIMTQERAPERTFMTLDGHEIFLETENLLLNYFDGDYSKGLMQNAATAAGIPPDTFQPFENSDFDFYAGFKSVRKAGYNFVFKNLHEFSDVQSVGASAYNYNQWRMIVPIGGQRINRIDGKPGFMWGYEYKQLGAYNREVVFGNIGGVGTAGTNGFLATPVNEYDRMKTGIIGEIAFHGACPNQSVIQRPE